MHQLTDQEYVDIVRAAEALAKENQRTVFIVEYDGQIMTTLNACDGVIIETFKPVNNHEIIH